MVAADTVITVKTLLSGVLGEVSPACMERMLEAEIRVCRVGAEDYSSAPLTEPDVRASHPYGATRISVATSTNGKRKFIGQFSDSVSSGSGIMDTMPLVRDSA
jgi:hypothetical protein